MKTSNTKAFIEDQQYGKKRKKVKNGKHRMPNGTMMKDSEMKKRKKGY